MKNQVKATVSHPDVKKVTIQQPSLKIIDKQQPMSLLPKDYANLYNLPTINGVEIVGDLEGKELNLLTTKKDDYPTIVLSLRQTSDKYFITIDDNDVVAKVPVEQAAATLASVKTNDELDTSALIGTYQFIEKKGE